MDLAKKDKPLRHGLTLFRPIILAFSFPNYKLVKHSVPILPDIIQNEFTIKYSLSFADEILMQNSNLDRTDCLGADSLLNNKTWNETIDICIQKLLENPETLVNEISKNDFCNLPNLVIKELIFVFNHKFHI